VEAYQLKESIVSYLTQGHQYRLVFGNPRAASDYDLKYFVDTLHKFLSVLTFGSVSVNPFYKPSVTAHPWTISTIWL